MPSEQNKLPSVLMLLLSSLGILISLLISIISIWGQTETATNESLLSLSVGSLAFFICLLNLPTLVFSIRGLKGLPAEGKPSLFKAASFSLIGWVLLILGGTLISKSGKISNALAPITVLAIAIPIWWLVEFARRGLKRPSPVKEANTLTLGLTLAPTIIMIAEIIFVIIASLIVVILLGIQPGTLTDLVNISRDTEFAQGGIEELEQLLFSLAQDPTISTAIFLIIGVIAPLTEELFKPLAVWCFLRSKAKISDGYSLGLISGAAFTLLESASLVSQITLQDWTSAVLLRSLTGLLHISLSGLVGYGITKARNEKRPGIALLCFFVSAALHGLWNSMALLNGFSTTSYSVASSGVSLTTEGIISIICMVLVFAVVVVITFKLNAKLRKQQANLEIEIAN